MGLLSSLFGGRPAVDPTHVATLADFKQAVLKADNPVIVNIWSPTCAPCKRLAPVLVDVATSYAERVTVVDIGTTAEHRLLSKLEVRSTPTLIMYEDGQEVGRISGFRPRGWFDEMIRSEFPDA